jgi:hypothetical protein
MEPCLDPESVYGLDIALYSLTVNSPGPIPVVDYYDLAESSENRQQSRLCNGTEPNTAGYYVMVPLAQQGIAQALQAASH